MRKKAEKGRVLSIFLTFLKFGCFTFGGGWSIIAQMQKEYVEKKHWITSEELLDFTSVGRSVPGLMVSNASVLFGYHAAGFGGALAALAGICLPPIVIMYGVTFVYGLVCNNLYIARAMMGVRAAVVPIILCALLNLTKSALKDRICWLIAIVAGSLSLFTGLSNVLIVVIGAAAGLLAMEVKSRHGIH
jgi:chromate transporter